IGPYAIRQAVIAKAQNKSKGRSDSTMSGSSTETIGTEDNQKCEDPTIGLKTRMRSYIDLAIQRITDTTSNNEAAQGNYPPTPVINSLILALGTEGQSIKSANNSETITYKATGRTFSAFAYTFKNNRHGKEKLRCCQENPQNLINNVKLINKNTVLQTSDSGVVMIKKWKQNTVLENISDWLIAFKAYLDAVFIIYKNCELELNTYCDHINELCIKYKFSTVMSYDKNCRVTLIMNQDSILTERNIEAERENFDMAAIKKVKDEEQQNGWTNTTWHDGKEICLN
ncbi:13382_t:CDS:2, partial [Cetraspora pellucida]